jgi:hypothetical protein
MSKLYQPSCFFSFHQYFPLQDISKRFLHEVLMILHRIDTSLVFYPHSRVVPVHHHQNAATAEDKTITIPVDQPELYYPMLHH